MGGASWEAVWVEERCWARNRNFPGFQHPRSWFTKFYFVYAGVRLRVGTVTQESPDPFDPQGELKAWPSCTEATASMLLTWVAEDGGPPPVDGGVGGGGGITSCSLPWLWGT